MDCSRFNIDPSFHPLIQLIFSLEEPFLRHFRELVEVRRQLEAIGKSQTAKETDKAAHLSFERRLRSFRCDIGAFVAEVDDRMYRSAGFLATRLGYLASYSYPLDRNFFRSVLRRLYFTDKNAWNGVMPSFAAFVEELARQSEGRTLYQLALQDATNFVYTSLDYSSVSVEEGRLVFREKAMLNILDGALCQEAWKFLRRILTLIASFYLSEPDYRELLSKESLELIKDRTSETLGSPVQLLHTPEPLYLLIEKDGSIVFGYGSPEATKKAMSLPGYIRRSAYSVIEWFFVRV